MKSDARSILNPTLHRLLEIRFGKVLRSYPGDATVYGRPRYNPRSKLTESTFHVSGEFYRISCPYCGDQRNRLYLHHLYMTPDPVNGRLMRHLAICYNDDCLKKHAREFETRLFELVIGRGKLPMMTIAPGRVATEEECEPRPPGHETRLDDLPRDHAACRYLVGRGFDIDKLAKVWGVSYCVQGDWAYPAATGRIIVPVYVDGEYRGWQARYVGDVDWKATGIRKYYNLPGMRKTNYLYNFDRASKSNVGVVCEGVTDAWVVGAKYGVALFGKTFSEKHLAAIRKAWGRKGLCLIALDPDAVAERSQTYSRNLTGLRSVFGRRLVEMQLPGRDPGAMTRRVFWELADGACDRAEIRLAKYKEH